MNISDFNRRHVEHAFDETGERARLRELLLQRLTECGWVTLVEEKCREYIRAKEVENVTLDEVVNEVKKDARKAVPEEVKREIMNLIRDFVARMLAERERHGVPKEGGVQIEEIFDQPGPSTSRDA